MTPEQHLDLAFPPEDCVHEERAENFVRTGSVFGNTPPSYPIYGGMG